MANRNTRINYLTEKLSDETLVHIVNYLPAHDDLVRLAETCHRFNNLLRDKDFCNKISFTWDAKLARASLTRFLQDKPRAAIITKLDVSDVYWIPSGIIRDLVVHMDCLEVLLAAGTCLSWAHLSAILKTLPIRKLSWSWDNNLEESCRRRSSISPTKFSELLELQDMFLKLKSLLIHIPMMTKIPTDVLFYSYSSLEFLISLCRNLEELFFLAWPKSAAERKSSSSSYSRRDLHSLGPNLPNLHTLVICVKGPPRFSPMNFFCKLVQTFGIVTPATVFWIDHPLLGVRSLYMNNEGMRFPRRNAHMYNMWTPQMCAEEATKLSYPLMSINEDLQPNFKYPKLKDILISHGQPVVTGLNGLLDNSPDLESFTCSTFNLRMDWKKFIANHSKLKAVCVSESESLEDYCVAFSKLLQLEKLSASIECLYEIKDATAISEYEIAMLAESADINTTGGCDGESVSNQSSTPSLFKKRRVGVPAKPQKTLSMISGLNLISVGCSKINELEIGYGELNTSRAGRLLPESLFCITRFKFLRKLSLSSLPIMHGKFLVEICSTCAIESLRLTHLGPMAKCCYIPELCQAVAVCSNLKDFRLEQNYIGNCLPLLTALRNCSKLQRLLIWSSPNDKPLDLEPILALFENCLKLMMFYATIESTTKSECFRIRKVLEAKYKKDRPGLSIIIRRTLEEEELVNYPSVHYRQMVVNMPQICQITDFNVFNG